MFAKGRRIFGKRANTRTTHNPIEKTKVVDTSEFKTIPVQRSVFDKAKASLTLDTPLEKNDSSASALVEAVRNYAEKMLSVGLYRREEITEKAVFLGRALYYEGQVNNGGHSQFIGNSGSDGPTIFEDAGNAIFQSGAEKHASIFQKFLSWVHEHPQEAAKQTGFGKEISPYLQQLDSEFYALNRETQLTVCLARWVLEWPEIRPVADDAYRDVITKMAKMNPVREGRLVAKRIRGYEKQVSDWLLVGLGMAATASPHSELRLSLLPGQFINIDGEEHVVWTVNTGNYRRFAVVTDDWARLYERNVGDRPDVSRSEELHQMRKVLNDGRFSQYQPASLGERISHVDARRIREVIDLAKRQRAAPAMDLLITKIGGTEELASVSAVGVKNFKGQANSIGWGVFFKQTPYFIITNDSGAELIRPNDSAVIARVEELEIRHHMSALSA